MKWVRFLVCVSFGLVWGPMALAKEPSFVLEKCEINLHDKASLQRGAALYVNYCLGCHSLKYMRYDQLGRDLKIVDEEGKVLEKLIVDNLNFLSDKITDPMTNSILPNDALNWFGIPPRDLSVVARFRGKDWLYTYLKSFYTDDARIVGVNNLIFKDVAMPHSLINLQGEQVPVYRPAESIGDHAVQDIMGVKLSKSGLLSPAEYDKALVDLVNFLEYVGEPTKQVREQKGAGVLLFLVIFTIFAYLLKREYWKDIVK